jgi:hypothetical protein
MSLKEIVDDYLRTRSGDEARYLKFYKTQTSRRHAIEKSAMAILPSGKRFAHQRRIPKAVLKEATAALQNTDLEECKDFDNLFRRVSDTIRPISGIGELTVYDTAHRLGAYYGLSPEFVYLHAGVRKGAMKLGIDCVGEKLCLEQLPKEFQLLNPEQIEDCLCIYKDCFSRIRGR